MVESSIAALPGLSDCTCSPVISAVATVRGHRPAGRQPRQLALWAASPPRLVAFTLQGSQLFQLQQSLIPSKQSKMQAAVAPRFFWLQTSSPRFSSMQMQMQTQRAHSPKSPCAEFFRARQLIAVEFLSLHTEQPAALRRFSTELHTAAAALLLAVDGDAPGVG